MIFTHVSSTSFGCAMCLAGHMQLWYYHDPWVTAFFIVVSVDKNCFLPLLHTPYPYSMMSWLMLCFTS